MTPTRVRDWLQRVRLERLRPLRIHLAGLARARARGRFIGVTGSSGKSTTTALIAAVLREKGSVVPQVMDNTINPLIRTVRRSRKADFVAVEAGVGGQGQMAAMAGLLRPDIAVVTLVGLEHYSAFRSREAIAAEKGGLVEATAADGLVVLNADDPLVLGMAARTRARVVTFGRAEGADCRILEVGGGYPGGVRVRLSWRGEDLEIPTRFIGRHFASAVAAAALTGLELGVPPAAVRRAIGGHKQLRARLSVHDISGGPTIILDSAKAPKDTLHLAFDALRDADAPRRRIVLGSISDYKGTRRKVYREAVAAALEVADEVILVTDSSRRGSVAPQAAEAGRFHVFPTTREAADHVVRTAIPGEVILLKGSSNLHLERILLDMTTTVRCWENTCKRGETCFRCGLFGHPHEEHARIRRRRRWMPFRRAGKPDADAPGTDAP